MTAPVSLCLLLISALIAQTPGEPKRIVDYSGKCSAKECHGSLIARKFVHSPVAEDSCDACHEPSDSGKHHFTFTEEGGDLCLDCHDEYESKLIHSPVADGSCTVCHDPHASDTPKLLTEESEGALCGECHDEVLEDLDYLHGPVAAETCTVCHDPHTTERPKLLKAEDGALCTTCHAEQDTRKVKAAYVHEPVSQGCLACHNPHGADNRMNLNATAPDLCVDCHDDIEEFLDSTVTHDAVTEGKSCVSCHTPHMSQHEHLLLSPTMTLCLSCHDKPVESGDSVLAAIKDQLSRANQHGPVQDRDCTACHSPHGGDNFRLLTEAYPADFYAPFDEEQYALCFDCHDVEAFEDEETDEATNFRNGERNLHYLHVNKEVKGRTCRACHEPHASNHAAHIADSVSFGSWRIPINFEQNPNGGSCQPGCHRAYRYDRATPVMNVRKSKPANGK